MHALNQENYFSEFLESYLNTLLDESLARTTDGDGYPLSKYYEVFDIDEESIQRCRDDCFKFLKKAESFLGTNKPSYDAKAFFRCRNKEELDTWCKRLQEIAERFGRVKLIENEATNMLSLISINLPPARKETSMILRAEIV